jgi:hypothetical protein
LTSAGIQIDERLPLIIEPTKYNRAYLETKASRAGHLFGKFANTTNISDIRTITQNSEE